VAKKPTHVAVSKGVKLIVINEQVNHMRLKFFMEHSEYNMRLKEFERDWAINERQYMQKIAADRCGADPCRHPPSRTGSERHGTSARHPPLDSVITRRRCNSTRWKLCNCQPCAWLPSSL
jgi:hypothetical protein